MSYGVIRKRLPPLRRSRRVECIRELRAMQTNVTQLNHDWNALSDTIALTRVHFLLDCSQIELPAMIEGINHNVYVLYSAD